MQLLHIKEHSNIHVRTSSHPVKWKLQLYNFDHVWVQFFCV